eukprot:1183832-Prorocentrum_minimum.AAC.2
MPVLPPLASRLAPKSSSRPLHRKGWLQILRSSIATLRICGASPRRATGEPRRYIAPGGVTSAGVVNARERSTLRPRGRGLGVQRRRNLHRLTQSAKAPPL